MTYIEPDEQAILALTRATTGAAVHDSNNLILLYRHQCALGDAEKAAKTKYAILLRTLALRLMQQSRRSFGRL